HDGRTRTAPQDLWPLLLLMAALLFPVDVGIRRLLLSPEEILGYARRGVEWARARIPGRAPAPERERALSRLLTAKARAEQGTAAAEGTPATETTAAGAGDERARPSEHPTPNTQHPTPHAPRV